MTKCECKKHTVNSGSVCCGGETYIKVPHNVCGGDGTGGNTISGHVTTAFLGMSAGVMGALMFQMYQPRRRGGAEGC